MIFTKTSHNEHINASLQTLFSHPKVGSTVSFLFSSSRLPPPPSSSSSPCYRWQMPLSRPPPPPSSRAESSAWRPQQQKRRWLFKLPTRKKPQEFSSRSSRISKGPPKSPPPPTKKSVKPPESKRNVDHSRNSALRELKSKNVYKLDKYVVNSKEVVGRRPLLCLWLWKSVERHFFSFLNASTAFYIYHRSLTATRARGVLAKNLNIKPPAVIGDEVILPPTTHPETLTTSTTWNDDERKAVERAMIAFRRVFWP